MRDTSTCRLCLGACFDAGIDLFKECSGLLYSAQIKKAFNVEVGLHFFSVCPLYSSPWYSIVVAGNAGMPSKRVSVLHRIAAEDFNFPELCGG